LKKFVTTSLLACAVAALAAQASAQQTPPPANDPSKPPASVPEQMPFDIPYGMSISTEQARQLVDAAAAEAKKHNWKMNIAVVDTNGELIAFERMQDAQVASVTIAQNKARTAARFRRSTRAFFAAFETGHGYIHTLDPQLAASPGGIPLVAGGKLIGAIGCSGGTGDQDEASCMAGAKMIQ